MTTTNTRYHFLGKFINTITCPFPDINTADQRYVEAVGWLVIWRPAWPLKPTLFKLFRPRTGLAKILRARRNFFVCGNLSLLAQYF